MSQKDIYQKDQNQSQEEDEDDNSLLSSESDSPQRQEKSSYQKKYRQIYDEEQRVCGEDDDELDDEEEENEDEDDEDEYEQEDNDDENEFLVDDNNYQKEKEIIVQQINKIKSEEEQDYQVNLKTELKTQNNYSNNESRLHKIENLDKQSEKHSNFENKQHINNQNDNDLLNTQLSNKLDDKIKEANEPTSEKDLKYIEVNNLQNTQSTLNTAQDKEIKIETDDLISINNTENIHNQSLLKLENQESQQESQIEEQQPVVKERKIELRPKVIYDPKNDVDKYPGSYSDSGESDDETNNDEDEDEDNEEQENDFKSKNNKLQLKKKNSQKEVSKKPVVKKVLRKQTLVFNVADTKYQVVKFVGKKIYKWKLKYDMESMDWDIFWTDNAVQPEQLGRMQPYQKINHFPGMFSLARKNHLARNLMKMRKQFPDQYKFFPQTWLLPAEYNDFKTQFEKSKQKKKIFIVKPEASCQGRGIFLTRSLDDLNPTDHYVVQRYLNKPYLIDGLKFDFRLYVLLAGCDPLRIYLYYEGLARFATEPYKEPNRDNMEDMCMHLTNYAINKDNPNFQFNDDKEKMDIGHKRSLTSVLQLLEDQGHDINKLWRDIKRVLIKTIISAQPNLAHHYRSCQPDNFMNNMCFEVLGFDIILDSNLKPWLLEVNHTPSFVTDTPLDSYIKKNTIRDSLKLMNCNCKAKNEIVNQRKEIMQKRVLTGKKVKYTPEEKQEEIKKAQQKRDEYEDKNLGGFERIYPIENDEDDTFNDYLQHALKCYEEQTGANIRRNTKKVIEDPKKITNQPKKLNQPKDLEKIYNTKIGKPPARKPVSQSTINKGIPGQPRPNSSSTNLEENENLQGEEEMGENGQIMRSASGRMYDFRIKKQSVNSPYNIHQKFKNKIQQGRVAIGLKELKLGEDPIQTEENVNSKPANSNNKKISAYMTSQQTQQDSKEQLEIRAQNILQDQNYNSFRTQQKKYPEHQIQMIQEAPKKIQNLNATKPPYKLQFQVIDNTALMEEERRQWLAQAQRNLQYQLSQQQYQPQQKITLLPKGPSMQPQNIVMQQMQDISNSANNKDILAAVGGAISGQYKSERRVSYKQKGGNLIQTNQASGQMKETNGLFLQPKLLEISSFQANQNLQFQQIPSQQSSVQNSIDYTKNRKTQFRN